MKKVLGCLTALSCILLFGVTLSSATPIFGTLLQDSLDDITISGPGIDVDDDQRVTELWTSTASGGAVSTLAIELAGPNLFAPTNEFGIYSNTDPSNKVVIFGGSASPGSQALISFLADGTIKLNGSTVATGFNANFGFFLNVYGLDGDPNTLDDTWFSQESLNSDSEDHLVAYQGDNLTTLEIPPYQPGLFTSADWILAFEDLAGSTWNNWSYEPNYSDMVVLVESIAPVPEPSTLLLLGLGLIGFGAYSRKKMQK